MQTSKALKIVKKFVADSVDKYYVSGKQQFICIAAQVAKDTGKIEYKDENKITKIIADRLYPYETITDWLIGNKALDPAFELDKETRNRLQKHRHAWLDMMIAEFEAKGD